MLFSSAANALTTVTDTILRADSTPANGTINVSWSAFRNASGQFIPAGNIRAVPIIAGVFTVNLEPNVGASPQGSSYAIVFQISGAPVQAWRWYVPVSATPVGLSVVQFPAPGLQGGSAAINPTQLLSGGATVGQFLRWNGSAYAPATGSGTGSGTFTDLTTGTNVLATMTLGSGSTLTYSGTGINNANRILGVTITGLSGSGGKLLETLGSLPTNAVLSSDANGNAVDSGILSSNVITSTGIYVNPIWLSTLAASKLTGAAACSNLPALVGDITTTAGSCTVAVTKANGLAFALSATTDTTVASNILSGTLAAARLPEITLNSNGAGGVTGNLQVASFNSGIGALSTTCWYGDGTWKACSGGTVTNTTGAFPAGRLIVGNSGNDVTALASLGTTTTVYHGNAGGVGAFSAVSLTADVSGLLPVANGGLNSASIAFSGPSGGAKTFALPNASSTILTSNTPVTLAQGGTGVDLSAITKGGLIVGTAVNTVAVKAISTDGFVLTADAASTGGIKWAAVVGTGTVTSVATTSPITGGTITATGTIACATCVTSAAALTANAIVLGGGSQASAVLGSLGTTATYLKGNAAGAPSFAAIAESEVTGLATDLTNRAAKGGAFAVSRTAVINSSGTIDGAAGTATDCVLVNGTSGPCGSGSGNMLLTSGATDPVGACTAGTGQYLQATTQDEWFCAASGVWKKKLSTTNTGPFVETGLAGTAPSTPAAGNVTCYFSSVSLTQICLDASANVFSAVRTASARTANQFVTFVPATGIPTTAAIVDADLPSDGRVRVCEVVVGDPDSASPVLTNGNDTPGVCANKTGTAMTITAVECYADAGSPTVTPIITGGGTILTGALTCGTGSFAAGTLSGTPTQANNGSIDANMTVAGGTARYVVIRITRTL